MGYNIDRLINILKQEDGYVEKRKNCPRQALYEKVGKYAGADNWTKYWRDMADAGLANYQGSYYCIATLFWGMVKTYGLSATQSLCLQKFMINCQITYDLFKKANQVYSTPKIGDIVVFWNGSRFHHAELVVSVKGDVVKTFGANTTAVTSVTVYNGGGCRYGKTYSLKALQSAGHKFLRPKYGEQHIEGWVKNEDRWKYRLSDGSFVKNSWKYIENRYYVFDGNGNMIRGWFLSNGQWYYLCGDGGMAEGWQKVDSHWYFLNSPAGEMHKGWLQDGNDWYYLNEDGEMISGCWYQVNGIHYVFQDSGKMISNTWFFDRDNWYYLSSTGAMVTNEWRQDKNGDWFYLGNDGKMVTDKFVKDRLAEGYYYVGTNGKWDGKFIDIVLDSDKEKILV